MATRKSLFILSILTVIALCAVAVQAQSTQPQSRYEGQITSVSPTRTIVLRDVAGIEWTFAVAPDAIIRRNMMPVPLEGLRLGDNALLVANGQAAIFIDAHSRL
jgi:hypothetical protein